LDIGCSDVLKKCISLTWHVYESSGYHIGFIQLTKFKSHIFFTYVINVNRLSKTDCNILSWSKAEGGIMTGKENVIKVIFYKNFFNKSRSNIGFDITILHTNNAIVKI